MAKGSLQDFVLCIICDQDYKIFDAVVEYLEGFIQTT